ncbi:MAG: phytanoyl-CoA dioxygenase family protein [Brevundimonas sp.]|uniref:phytanoyl-CoA dioxygenase family protein n=1 Tax=Brevundimonas sp. TaxID=1871086 RepID=UPI002AB8F782|nr:phytanoyl-CoA dioxygenase family protein [Brevundimonas sp.]MDZ4113572.1 phytanoyl-CoA dioxygenase family protein [Brevundimonas sp.]
MRNSFKDPALQARFAADGFVTLPLLTPEEAAHWRAEAVQLLPPAPGINDPQGALYSSMFDEGGSAALGALARTVFGDRLEALLDDYRDEGACLLAKLPGTSSLVMHQHQPMTPDIFEPALHCWLTLDDVGPDTGALRVVPGSHQIVRHVQSFNAPPFFQSFAQALEDRHAVTVSMRAGEAIVFDRALLHGSCANKGAEPAIRLLAGAIPRESTFCIMVESANETFDALEVGGKQIDPTLHCIAGGNEAGLKNRGRLANRNEQITEAEFEALLALGKRIQPGYDPIDEVRMRMRPASLSEKIRSFARAALGA